jgi:hypothetical protein
MEFISNKIIFSFESIKNEDAFAIDYDGHSEPYPLINKKADAFFHILYAKWV